MAKSKIIYDGKVLIDLTGDSVQPDNLLKGYTAHGKNGELVTGSCDYDVNSSGANAAAAEILAGKTAAVKGAVVTGSMKNNSAVKGNITTKDGKYTVPQGYHDGSGTVGISAEEQAKIIADNIREGITILGVEGAMSGTEDAKPQQKTVTPDAKAQVILPDSDKGYNYLSQVTVEPIPYSETENEAGGVTVTIG